MFQWWCMPQIFTINKQTPRVSIVVIANRRHLKCECVGPVSEYCSLVCMGIYLCVALVFYFSFWKRLSPQRQPLRCCRCPSRAVLWLVLVSLWPDFGLADLFETSICVAKHIWFFQGRSSGCCERTDAIYLEPVKYRNWTKLTWNWDYCFLFMLSIVEVNV